jgi:hypothetical protein
MLSNSCAVRAKKLSNHFQPDAVKSFHKNIFLLEAFYISFQGRLLCFVKSILFLDYVYEYYQAASERKRKS